MASSEKGQIVHGGQWEIDPKCAKTHKYLNLEHTFETSKMTIRQVNSFKPLKIIKNHARYQEISKLSTEKGQVVHGDQWEIKLSAI